MRVIIAVIFILKLSKIVNKKLANVRETNLISIAVS